MREGTVPSSCKVMIPAAEFLHPGSGRLRPSLPNRRQRPQHIKIVSCVSAVSFVPVRRHGHASKVVCAFGFPQLVEEHGRHATFAVVFMRFDPRLMISVRYGSFSRVESKKLRAQFNSVHDFCIVNTRIASQHHADRQR